MEPALFSSPVNLSWSGLMLFMWGIALISINRRQWKRIWPASLMGVIALYVIDSSLIKLKAFYYNGAGPELNGLPLVYILAMLPGGPLLLRYYPVLEWHRVLFIILVSGLFLAAEWLCTLSGAMVHENWSLPHSFVLNIIGFATVLWFFERAGLTLARDRPYE